MGGNGTYNPFQSNASSQPSATNVFLDNYAGRQQSPLKGVGATITSNNMSDNGGSSGNNELDRLARERNELLATGSYTTDDPVI